MEKRASILILLILLGGSTLFAGTESPSKVCPLPIAEVEGVLSGWLHDSGFRVIRAPAEGGRVRLMGFKGNETWLFFVEPRSPLASRVLAEHTVNGKPDIIKVGGLWNYLEDYMTGASLEGNGVSNAVPTAISVQKESVVCIRAKTRNDLLQFTGFAVDKGGLILSTAHDLSDVQDVIVTLDNGQEVAGRLAKIDPRRDLALIDVARNLSSTVPLARARDMAQIGERIYSISCSNTYQMEFHAGIIDGPMRRANDLPLLQVQMQTLPGSSGSPVFDVEGNLIGVVKGRYRGTDSVGFVIPLETAREFLWGK